MKKLITVLFLSLFAFSSSQSEISVGVTGNLGVLDAQGKETFNGGTTTKSEEATIAFASAFAEFHLNENFRLGASLVPYALESETTESVRSEGERGNGLAFGTNTNFTPKSGFTQKVQVDIEDLMQAYLSFHRDGFFLKGGFIEADLITNEVLGSGSSYGNSTLEGTFVGAGIERDLNNGMFIRAEAQFSDYDDVTINSTGGEGASITVSDMSGITGAISIGKTF